MKKEDYNRYIFIIMIALLVLAAIFMISPFARPILAAAIISYIFYPLYKKIDNKIKNPSLSSAIVVFGIVIIISIPLIFLLTTFYGEAKNIVTFVQDKMGGDEGLLMIENKSATDFIDDISGQTEEKYSLGEIENKSAEILSESKNLFSDINYKSIVDISTQVIDLGIVFFLTFFELVIMMFMSFFFMKDGPTMLSNIEKTFEFKAKKGNPILKTLRRTVYGVVYGLLVIAIIQGTVAGIGYYVVSLLGGLKNPILWAVLTMFAAVVPTLGTSIIWLPLCIYLVGSGFYVGNYNTVMMGAGLFAYCSLIVASVDNLVSPYVIGGKAKMHPVLVLVAILGGLSVFGFIGIVVGPVVFALLLKLFELHKLRKLL